MFLECSELLLGSQTASFAFLLCIEPVPVAPAASVPEAAALFPRCLVVPLQHEVKARAHVLSELANI